MLAMEVIKPGQADLASPIDLVPKMDENLRFGFGYRKLNAMTVWDSYLIMYMDQGID